MKVDRFLFLIQMKVAAHKTHKMLLVSAWAGVALFVIS